MFSFLFSFFKKTKVQFSPPVKGRITNNGQPLSGVEVVRELFYRGYDENNSITDYALTNTNGDFSFNEKTIKSRYPGHIFGENFPVSQEIYIKKEASEMKDVNDKYYWLWGVSKNWKTNPFLNNLLLQLNADLQNTQIQHEVDLTEYNDSYCQVIASICYWQDDLITTYYHLEIVTSYAELDLMKKDLF